jgi:hypothetical protein
MRCGVGGRGRRVGPAGHDHVAVPEEAGRSVAEAQRRGLVGAVQQPHTVAGLTGHRPHLTSSAAAAPSSARPVRWSDWLGDTTCSPW